MNEYTFYKDRAAPVDPKEDEPIETQLTAADGMPLKVRAIFSRSPEKLPDGEIVWLKIKGAVRAEARPDNPWRVKILESFPLEEEVGEIEVKKIRISPGAKGDMLRSLIREREEQKEEEK